MLASRDALTAFFARLGYNTNDRLTQSIAAMNIGGDALTSTITHIERIASQDGGFLKPIFLNCALSPWRRHRALCAHFAIGLAITAGADRRL